MWDRFGLRGTYSVPPPTRPAEAGRRLKRDLQKNVDSANRVMLDGWLDRLRANERNPISAECACTRTSPRERFAVLVFEVSGARFRSAGSVGEFDQR
jgi:hypothetical protein